MKILIIRGKNLASLEKEFVVDFTVEPLRSAGIFAITGSTGSGKSTLLDALCLALFDASPRTKYITESIALHDVSDKTVNQRDCRNILRRGASEGYAEVTFIALDGDIYCTRWSVRRARNRADGSLQNSEIRIVNLSTNKEEQGTKTELLYRITTLLGLTFEQFTRSVLLAQGDFATFLKACQSEKAELLEKLTGTDVYSRISVVIYEKAKNAEAEWNALHERIKSIELLTDEQTRHYEAEQATMQQALTTQKKETEKLTAQLKWITDNERLLTSVKQAENNCAAAHAAVVAAQERQTYIELIDRVQSIRDTFGLLKDTEKQVIEYRASLQTAIAQRNETGKLLAEKKRLLAECEKEQESLAEKQREIAPQIVRARELDVRIQETNTLVADARQAYNVAKTGLEGIDKNSNAYRTALHKKTETLHALNKWIEDNSNYESIVARTELLVNLATDAQTAIEQQAHNRRTVATYQTLLDERCRQLDLLKREAEELNALLPAEIAVLRLRLAVGTPCPVCGSLHHPTAKVETDQRMKEQELNNAKEKNARKQETLNVEIERGKNEISRLLALVENYTTQYDRTRQRLAEMLTPLSKWRQRFEQSNGAEATIYAELQKYLVAQTKQWQLNTETRRETQEAIALLSANLENETNKRQETEENLRLKTNKLAELCAVVERLTTERNGLLHGKPADAAEQYFVDRQKTFRDKLKEMTDSKNACAARYESLNGVIDQIQHNVATTDEKRRTLQIAVDSWLAETPRLGISTVQQLAEALAKDHAWIQTEKMALKQLAEAETTAVATRAERRQTLERHGLSTDKPENADTTVDNLQRALADQIALTDETNKRLHAMTLALAKDAQAREQVRGLEQTLALRSVSTESWRKLNALLGSANGNKFKEIAQGYTLDALLVYANMHLLELAPRYRLQRIPNTLALQVVDMDMLNEIRTIHSLSGGESFLVSLSLALGLSSLSSNRMKVESLFIDEGFGSLDSETLRIAMDALGRLHTQGRKIGIISHVVEMTERIAAQIQIVKTANGRSEVRTPRL